MTGTANPDILAELFNRAENADATCTDAHDRYYRAMRGRANAWAALKRAREQHEGTGVIEHLAQAHEEARIVMRDRYAAYTEARAVDREARRLYRAELRRELGGVPE